MVMMPMMPNIQGMSGMTTPFMLQQGMGGMYLIPCYDPKTQQSPVTGDQQTSTGS